jgi:hypothetical protein
LLPAGSPKYAIADAKVGTADWHPFRDPAERAAAPAEESDDQDVAGDEPAGESGDELEAEIRDLIADYNDVAVEKDVDEMLTYHREDQQDGIRPIIEAGFTLRDKLPNLLAALKDKLPDSGDRIAAAVALLGDPTGNVLAVESLSVVNDSELTAKLSGGVLGSTCRFVLIDDEWFIAIPDTVDLSALKPTLDTALAGFDEWVETLSGDEGSAEDVLVQIETLGEALGR